MRELPIIVDTREKTPWLFPATMKAGSTSYKITVQAHGIPAGDYSLEGYGGRPGEMFGISIERKKDFTELAGNLTHERDRFEREGFRLSLYKCRLLIIQQPRDAALCKQYRSNLDPAVLLASLDSWQEKYCIPVVFTNGPEEAMEHALSVLRRFFERQHFGGAVRDSDPRKQTVELSCHDWADTMRRLAHVENALERLTRGGRQA